MNIEDATLCASQVEALGRSGPDTFRSVRGFVSGRGKALGLGAMVEMSRPLPSKGLSVDEEAEWCYQVAERDQQRMLVDWHEGKELEVVSGQLA
jgi:hypothetical protein